MNENKKKLKENNEDARGREPELDGPIHCVSMALRPTERGYTPSTNIELR